MTPAAYIDRNTAGLLRRLRKLIGISTVNPPGENYDLITAGLTRDLAELGLKAQRFPIPTALLKRSLPAVQHAFPRFNVLGKLAVPERSSRCILMRTMMWCPFRERGSTAVRLAARWKMAGCMAVARRT